MPINNSRSSVNTSITKGNTGPLNGGKSNGAPNPGGKVDPTKKNLKSNDPKANNGKGAGGSPTVNNATVSNPPVVSGGGNKAPIATANPKSVSPLDGYTRTVNLAGLSPADKAKLKQGQYRPEVKPADIQKYLSNPGAKDTTIDLSNNLIAINVPNYDTITGAKKFGPIWKIMERRAPMPGEKVDAKEKNYEGSPLAGKELATFKLPPGKGLADVEAMFKVPSFQRVLSPKGPDDPEQHALDMAAVSHYLGNQEKYEEAVAGKWPGGPNQHPGITKSMRAAFELIKLMPPSNERAHALHRLCSSIDELKRNQENKADSKKSLASNMLANTFRPDERARFRIQFGDHVLNNVKTLSGTLALTSGEHAEVFKKVSDKLTGIHDFAARLDDKTQRDLKDSILSDASWAIGDFLKAKSGGFSAAEIQDVDTKLDKVLARIKEAGVSAPYGKTGQTGPVKLDGDWSQIPDLSGDSVGGLTKFKKVRDWAKALPDDFPLKKEFVVAADLSKRSPIVGPLSTRLGDILDNLRRARFSDGNLSASEVADFRKQMQSLNNDIYASSFDALKVAVDKLKTSGDPKVVAGFDLSKISDEFNRIQRLPPDRQFHGMNQLAGLLDSAHAKVNSGKALTEREVKTLNGQVGSARVSIRSNIIATDDGLAGVHLLKRNVDLTLRLIAILPDLAKQEASLSGLEDMLTNLKKAGKLDPGELDSLQSQFNRVFQGLYATVMNDNALLQAVSGGKDNGQFGSEKTIEFLSNLSDANNRGYEAASKIVPGAIEAFFAAKDSAGIDKAADLLLV